MTEKTRTLLVAGRCDSYQVAAIRQFVEQALAGLGFVPARGRVLLKPNLLTGKSSKKAVNTHPTFVAAVAEVFLDAGCDVSVGDSPGYESTEKALAGSGIMPVVRRLGLRVAPFAGRIAVQNGGISPYRELTFGEDPGAYDLIINLPKLKTHTMMGLTAGVKNTFGFVPSFDKARWHLRCGTDRALFAALLLDIHRLVNPGLTILDGITAMEGDGPSSGHPLHAGIVAVSRDAIALDWFIEQRIGVTKPLPVTAVALEKGLLSEPEVIDLGMPAVEPFVLPRTMDVGFGMPALIRETARRVFLRKPRCVDSRCKLCETCIEVCPAKAISIEHDLLKFDYKKCIRCYCCQELCPHSAITV